MNHHAPASARPLLLAAALGAAWLLASAATAGADLRQLELTRQNAATTVSSGLDRIAAKDTLTVRCVGFACEEVRASVDKTAVILSPTASSGTERSFEIPDGVPSGAFVEIRTCLPSVSEPDCGKTAVVAKVAIAAAAPPPDRSTALKFCSDVGARQAAELRADRGRDDFTVILFDESGPCYISRQFGAEGDPILIGFVAVPGPTVSLDLDPCATLSATPKVLIGADISSLALQSRSDDAPLAVEWFPPVRRCFGVAAGVKVSVTSGTTTKPLAYTLKQFERYRATLQVGIALSRLHQQTFGLRADGAAKRIIETSAGERGPEYLASVVLYAIPRYFEKRSTKEPCLYVSTTKKDCSLAGPEGASRAYFGRDPVNETAWKDRVGLMLGTGLNQPGRRFLIGGTFELITGVNAFVASESVRRPELEGVATDDVFAGEAATIPVRDHWRQAWVSGVAIDARYALALFGRK